MTPFDDEPTMEEGRDARIGELLAILDPDLDDPGYWHRFHRWAVNGAGPELARRRRVGAVTVADIVVSWWRTLVPAAGLAAALATVTLMSETPRDVVIANGLANGTVEELLTVGLEPAPLPAGLAIDGEPIDDVALASESF